MKIIPLSEGRFTIDSSKQFIPFDEMKHELNDRPRGSLLVEIQPFVVISKQDVLLLDAGLGFTRNDGRLQLHANLQNAGIDPASVTKVLLTHLHKDHAGGLGGDKPAFPHAHYYVQKAELDFAFKKGAPSYDIRDLECLRNNDRVVLLEGEGTVDGYIRYKLTGAHSPFHQVFWIREDGQTAFFGGDEAPQLQQMKHRFVAKYDYDGKKATGLRKEWWERGTSEHWLFLFYHDINNALYQK